MFLDFRVALIEALILYNGCHSAAQEEVNAGSGSSLADDDAMSAAILLQTHLRVEEDITRADHRSIENYFDSEPSVGAIAGGDDAAGSLFEANPTQASSQVAQGYIRRMGVFCSNAKDGRIFGTLAGCIAQGNNYCVWLCSNREYVGLDACVKYAPSQCDSFVDRRINAPDGAPAPGAPPNLANPLEAYKWFMTLMISQMVPFYPTMMNLTAGWANLTNNTITLPWMPNKTFELPEALRRRLEIHNSTQLAKNFSMPLSNFSFNLTAFVDELKEAQFRPFGMDTIPKEKMFEKSDFVPFTWFMDKLKNSMKLAMKNSTDPHELDTPSYGWLGLPWFTWGWAAPPAPGPRQVPIDWASPPGPAPPEYFGGPYGEPTPAPWMPPCPSPPPDEGCNKWKENWLKDHSHLNPTRDVIPTSGCPVGSERIGEDDVSGISGCGLTSCDIRFAVRDIHHCQKMCIDMRPKCVAYTWANVGGDADYASQKVCSVYATAKRTAEKGPSQVMCKLENRILSCPLGTKQVGLANADISGCGMTSCEMRYSVQSMVQCRQHCDAQPNCKAFSWAPPQGDKEHQERRVCTIYDTKASNALWGPNQILCEVLPMANELRCPLGSEQVGLHNSVPAGCGITPCNSRYETKSIGECQQMCMNNTKCKAFTYAPPNGDEDNIAQHVCGLYGAGTLPIKLTGGTNRIMCRMVPVVMSCPLGSQMVGLPNSDIGGCGITSCNERYTAKTLNECRDKCKANMGCQAFTFAPPGGDRDHLHTSVCSMYSEQEPNAVYGPKQIFCKFPKWKFKFEGCPRVNGNEMPDGYTLRGPQTFANCATLCTGECKGFEIASCTKDGRCNGVCATFNSIAVENGRCLGSSTTRVYLWAG